MKVQTACIDMQNTITTSTTHHHCTTAHLADSPPLQKFGANASMMTFICLLLPTTCPLD